MGHLLSSAIKMQSSAATTYTVYYTGSNGFCTGMTISINVNGYYSYTGTSTDGVVNNVASGTLLTASNTTGPKASGFCTTAQAYIGSTPGGNELASNTATGIGVTASVSYTISPGSPTTIYITAGIGLA